MPTGLAESFAPGESCHHPAAFHGWKFQQRGVTTPSALRPPIGLRKFKFATRFSLILLPNAAELVRFRASASKELLCVWWIAIKADAQTNGR